MLVSNRLFHSKEVIPVPHQDKKLCSKKNRKTFAALRRVRCKRRLRKRKLLLRVASHAVGCVASGVNAALVLCYDFVLEERSKTFFFCVTIWT